MGASRRPREGAGEGGTWTGAREGMLTGLGRRASGSAARPGVNYACRVLARRDGQGPLPWRPCCGRGPAWPLEVTVPPLLSQTCLHGLRLDLGHGGEACSQAVRLLESAQDLLGASGCSQAHRQRHAQGSAPPARAGTVPADSAGCPRLAGPESGLACVNSSTPGDAAPRRAELLLEAAKTGRGGNVTGQSLSHRAGLGLTERSLPGPRECTATHGQARTFRDL